MKAEDSSMPKLRRGRIVGRACTPSKRLRPALEGCADAVAEEIVVLPSGFEAIVERPRFRPNGLGEVKIAEAARYLGMCERTLRDRIRDGLPHPPFKVRAGKRYFNLNDLHAWALKDAA